MFQFHCQNLVMRILLAAKKTGTFGMILENSTCILGGRVQPNQGCITVFYFDQLQYLNLKVLSVIF